MSQVSLRVTTKQKPIVETNKKKKKESKYMLQKNHQFTKEESKRKKGTKELKTENNEQDGNSKSLL